MCVCVCVCLCFCVSVWVLDVHVFIGFECVVCLGVCARALLVLLSVCESMVVCVVCWYGGEVVSLKCATVLHSHYPYLRLLL